MPDLLASSDQPKKRLVTGARAACFVIGCLLVAAAVWAIARNHDKLSEAWDAAGDAPAILIALCLILPIVNWVCTACTIWTLTGRYGRVGFTEMLGLIGSAWLLNLLPLRLGMIGRIAYHKKFHGIKVRECAKVLFQALGCTVVALGVLVLWVQVVRNSLTDSTADTALSPHVSHAELFSGTTLRTLALVCIPLPVCFLVFAAVRYWSVKPGSLFPHSWRWPAAIMFRYADMLTWVVRYAVVFAVIGRPMPMMQAAIITVSAQAAMLTPVQFGLREWAVGATAAFIGGEANVVRDAGENGNVQGVDTEGGGASGSETRKDSAPLQPITPIDPHAPLGERGNPRSLLDSATPGLMADVMMRAAELVIILPVGFVSTWWLWRRMRRAKVPRSVM